jgi:hypothetical protein
LFRLTGDFDPGAGTYSITSAGSEDIFVSKLDASGYFVWARSMGGTSGDAGLAIDVDASGNAYTTGYFYGTADFDPGNATFNLTSQAGSMDIFISKLFANGNFGWAGRIGGGSSDDGYSIAVDSLNSIYTTGFFTGNVDFDPGINFYSITSFSSSMDVFVHKMTQCSSTGSSITVSACNCYTSPGGNHTWTVSNIYNDTIANHAGCDSIITINLTVKYSSSATIAPVVCDSYTSPGGHLWTTSNTYTDTIPNHAGCDSIITVNLTVKHSSNGSISPVVCGSYTSPGGHLWTASNTYSDTIPNHAGCDSIITVHLTVNHSSSATIALVACFSYTSPSGNYSWNTSNTYYDTIPNHSGCDSIITINLTVNTVDASVTVNDPWIIANAAGAGYLWIDCNTMQAFGISSQSFHALYNGVFAVIVTQNGCTDTSDCNNIYTVGIAKSFKGNILRIYPMPSDGSFTIDPGDAQNICEVHLADLQGNIIFQQAAGNNEKIMISGLKCGAYVLTIIWEDNTTTTSKIMIGR